MSQEIGTANFTPADLVEFKARLRAETDLLATWIAEGVLASGPKTGGYELEGWLVGPDLRDRILAAIDSPDWPARVRERALAIEQARVIEQARAIEHDRRVKHDRSIEETSR